ncbi:MAG: major capsid protein, partial [Burkholderiaceae bacterium]
MATLAVTHPTLLDLKNRMDSNGSIAAIVEMLGQTNEIIEDMVWLEANELTGHTTTVRTGLPTPTWRKLYGGVQPTKSTTRKIKDTIGMLEAYAEVDQALADLNGNAAAFRLSEDRAHIEGMNQEFAQTLFYGNEATEAEAFTGLAPRFNSNDTAAALNAENVIAPVATPDSADNTSIWLVCWGPTPVFGLFPKG